MAIPKSAAASLEAMINYQLPEGGSPSTNIFDSMVSGGCGSFGAIGMGDKKMGSFGGARGLNLGSMMAPCLPSPVPALREEEEEDDPRSLLITGMPRFLF